MKSISISLDSPRSLRYTAAMALSDELPGTWELLSRIDLTDDGRRRVDPSLGEDPIALLIYDRSGHFSAQFMKRDRSGAAADDAPAAAGPNNTRARSGYDAYFGTYTIDDAKNAVTQTLRGALSAENVGAVVTREMTVAGNQLTIRLRTAAADGETVTRALTWRRVG